MFSKNKILSEKEELADRLKQLREDKGLDLKDVSDRLGINCKYLKMLENGDYDSLPPGAYGKNFLREYAIYLGLDYKKVKKTVEENKKNDDDVKKSFFSKQVVKKHNFLIFPKIVKNFLIISTVTICFVYLGFYLKKIVSPPQLTIMEPQDNLVTEDNSVNIVGLSEAETEIIINGEAVLSDADGFFSKQVNLKNGINTIIATAKRKYGRENIIKRQILVNDL